VGGKIEKGRMRGGMEGSEGVNNLRRWEGKKIRGEKIIVVGGGRSLGGVMIKSMGRGIARGEGHGGRVSIMLAGYGGGEKG